MVHNGQTAEVFRFGIFEADIRSGELFKSGRKISLQEQPFEVLVMLLNRPAAVLTHEELRETLWAGHTFVDFDHGIRTAINKIRNALGDSAENPRFIETLPRRGYRFIAPVLSLNGNDSCGGVARTAALTRSPSPTNAESYELYLKGTYAQKRSAGGLVTGIQSFRDAIARDGNFAPAYVGLALSYLQMGFGYGPLSPSEALHECRQAALQALRLDATLAEAESCRGWVKAFRDWDWWGGERDFRHAIEVNSSSADAHRLYAWYLSAMGRHNEAITHALKASEVEPDSLAVGYTLAAAYYWAHCFEGAAAEAAKLEQMDPTFPGAQRLQGGACLQTGSYDKAIRHFQREVALCGEDLSVWGTAHLGCSYARSGNVGAARGVLYKLRSACGGRYVSPYLFAIVYTSLGEREQAWQSLERAYGERNPMLSFLRVDPLFDGLRSDSCYGQLLEGMNFPE